MFRADNLKLYVIGISVLLLTIWVFSYQYTGDWRDYQADFNDLVAEKFGEERAALIPAGIQQIWVKDLDRTDRCITCHQGVEWKGLENAEEPFRTHSKEILQKHPLSEFGCTVCHGGQGFATDMESAHGNVEHWEEPLLGKDIGEAHLVKDPKTLMQTNCNVCHRYDKSTVGAEMIDIAKNLVQEKNCRACHAINGRGGTIGPDLTYEGDKPAEQYDYSSIPDQRTAFAWQTAHFQNPKAVSKDSIMPNFGFTNQQSQALALLVLSWRRATIPARYLSGVQLKDVPTQEEINREKQMLEGEGAFFVKKGCFTCHAVTSLGIESASKIGPDLSEAVTDVQSRFGRTLDDFLMNPTGTMSVVLATQIPLTIEERKEAIATLRIAYQRKQEQQNKAGAAPKPSPPKK